MKIKVTGIDMNSKSKLEFPFFSETEEEYDEDNEFIETFVKLPNGDYIELYHLIYTEVKDENTIHSSRRD